MGRIYSEDIEGYEDATYSEKSVSRLMREAAFGKEGFRLLCLWYDAFGEGGATHRKEIEAFSKATRSDGIKFHSLTYQELITKLAEEYRSQPGKYIEYISGRYL